MAGSAVTAVGRGEQGTGVNPFLRAADDLRRLRGTAGGGGPGVRAAQHLPAVRWRARPGRAVDCRDDQDGGRARGLRRIPTPSDLHDALTRGYSAALLVGALFAIAGIAVVLAMIRVDRSKSPQVADSRQEPEIISDDELAAAAAPVG